MSSFRRPLQVQMPDVYELVKGQKVKTADGVIKTIQASVQPPRMYDFDQVSVQLGGARIERVILVTTVPGQDLPYFDQYAQKSPCFFLWQGRRYRNMFPREGLAGVIPHMQYWAVQEMEGEIE